MALDRGSRLPGPGAAQQGLQSGQQLGQVEGLDHVVVSAGLQPGDPVFQRVARGQQQHRQGRLALAQMAQHAETVEQRQADVEHRDVEGLLCSR